VSTLPLNNTCPFDSPAGMPTATVLVLGDVGRSPRMCNHAMSLAEEGVDVNLVGYEGAQPPEKLKRHHKISLVAVKPVPESFGKWSKTVQYVAKSMWQGATLLSALLTSPKAPDVLLVQNPPSVPVLPICVIYCWLFRLGGCKLAVDWHNYGYTIMAMASGGKSALVSVAHWMERFFGAKASAAFCVTDAMRTDLARSWGVEAVTLYDRPPGHFKPLSGEDREAFLRRFQEEHAETFLTSEVVPEKPLWSDEHAIVVSSTSWTEDEDFALLLEALEQYEQARKVRPELPLLSCIITGKGPQRYAYCNVICARAWKHVRVSAPWLPAEDYPKLLACADLGISLHTSSSGLDLPMKVVDMLGCGVPVAAVDFPALPELIKPGRNGIIFNGHQELSEALLAHFDGSGFRPRIRDKYKDGVAAFGHTRWSQYWKQTALPVLAAMWAK